MTAVVLHLSDIHLKTPKDPILARASDIAACVFSSLPSAAHVFIVISGDVAFSGEKEQYALATEFLTKIRDTVRTQTTCSISFVVTPGNHDCNFRKNTGARKLLVGTLEGQEPVEVDESIIANCTEIQGEFFDFRCALEARSPLDDDLLWRTSRFDVEGRVVDFDCLNVSWVSKLKEDSGRLYFPIDRYQRKAHGEADARIVVLHHPLNWFNQSMYRPFRTFVRKIASVVVSGHEHQGTVGTVTDADTGTSHFIEGCVLQGEHDLTDSTFNLITLDLERRQFLSTQYRWNGTRYLPTEEGSWSDYHDLPAKRVNPFQITEAFQGQLDDPGAYLKHPGGADISLSDIYVYPDLRRIGDGDRRRVIISSTKLLAPETTADGVSH